MVQHSCRDLCLTSKEQRSGIQGFQRIWWAHLIGEWDPQSFLNVEVRYDYEDTPTATENHTFTAAQLGASIADHRIRIKPNQQNVSAIKFIISENAATTHALRFSNVELMVGVKRGKLKPLKDSATV